MGSKKNSEEMKNIQESLKAIRQEMQKIFQSMKSKLVNVLTELTEIKHSQEFLSALFEEMKNKIKDLAGEVKTTKQENAELKERVKFLEKDSILNAEALNDLAQYSRRDCLEIKGVSHEQNECTDKLVITVAQKCGIQINENDISVSHRITAPTPAKPNPSIIVKFVSRKTRDMIYNSRQVPHKLNQATKKSNTILDNVQLSSRKGLAGTHSDKISFLNESFNDMNATETLPKDKICINESLTYTNRQRFNKCLQFKKLNNWAYIWTQNGATLLKKNSESNTEAIKSDLDLQKLK